MLLLSSIFKVVSSIIERCSKRKGILKLIFVIRKKHPFVAIIFNN